MIKFLFSAFFTPSAETVARRELEEAERTLLQAQSSAEYAAQIVVYHRARVERLKRYVHQAEQASLRASAS